MREHARIGIAAVLVLAAILAGAWLRTSLQEDPAGEPKPLIIAYSPFEASGLLFIAEDRGFFTANGLNVTLRKYDTGNGALGGMVNGEDDIAVGTTEFPAVLGVFRGESLRIIGSIDKAEYIYLIGRKDRINEASDLRWKRVGTTLGTVAHFHLGRFLTLHGMNMKDVDLVDVKTPAGWVDAVAEGDIDAIATAQPYANAAKERLGDNAIAWPIQGGQPMYSLVISTDGWLRGHRETERKLLSSLAEAEEYSTEHPAESKGIIQRRLNLDDSYSEDLWSQNRYSLSLDQSLIIAMEDEARWMMENNLTNATEVPNFLNSIDATGIKRVKPEAVTLIS